MLQPLQQRELWFSIQLKSLILSLRMGYILSLTRGQVGCTILRARRLWRVGCIPRVELILRVGPGLIPRVGCIYVKWLDVPSANRNNETYGGNVQQ